jgi:hypothetical protein
MTATTPSHAGALLLDAVWADWIEQYICNVLEGNLLDEPEYLARELERRRGDMTAQQAVTTNDRLLIEDKLAALDQRLKRWQDAYEAGHISPDEFGQLKAGIDRERHALKRVKAELQGHLDHATQVQQNIAAAVAFIEWVNDELPTYNIPERRWVLEVLEGWVFYADRWTIRMKFWIPAE